MLLWLNGPFGVGKTTTATALAADGAHLFDPEIIGYLLQRLIDEPVDDFQDWPAWRVLVAETAVQLHEHHGGLLVAPMSLLSREYATQIVDRVAAQGIPQQHVVLHCEAAELERRIRTDTVETGAVQWRLDAVARYDAALPWLRDGAHVVDTTTLTPAEVVRAVRDVVR